jgi:hypothetical protein
MSARRDPMAAERPRYLDSCGVDGGTATGFREWIKKRCYEDPRLFPVDAIRDKAATAAWQAQPRRDGPDLFTIGGVTVPEFLTRPKNGHVDGEDLEDEDGENGFEKVAQQYATVRDRRDDALIKLRKAAQSSAAAEKLMQNADECRRLAHGNMGAFLRDLADH